MKLKTILALMAAIAMIGVAACGGDDDDDGDGATTTEATTTEEAGGDAEGSGGEASGGSEVTFTADPGGSLAYEEDSATADAGEVTVALTNEATIPHDVRIEDADGNDLGGTDQITEGEDTATVELEAGDYTFYCSVAGHREAGMEGTLTVK